MTQEEQKLPDWVLPLWRAWSLLKDIRARDGVPYHGPNSFSGRAEYIREKEFGELVEDCRKVLGEYAQPWPPKEKKQ